MPDSNILPRDQNFVTAAGFENSLVPGDLHAGQIIVATGRVKVDSVGSATSPGGLNTQLQFNNAGVFGGITGAVTDGTAVSLTAPHFLNPTINGAGIGLATLVYPNTATSATITIPATTGTLALTSQLTSGTVTSVSGTTNRITSTGGTTPIVDISATFEALLGKVANPLSQFAATTSAQLAGVISDETGTGSAVFASKPTFVGTVQTIVAVAALALDGSLGSIFTKTIATGSTLTQSNFSPGQCFIVKISGAFTVTWFSGITWITSGASAPTQAAITTYGFVCTGSNTFDGYLVGTQ